MSTTSSGPSEANQVPPLPDLDVRVFSVSDNLRQQKEIGRGRGYQTTTTTDGDGNTLVELYITGWATPISPIRTIQVSQPEYESLKNEVSWLKDHLAALVHALGGEILLTADEEAHAQQELKVMAVMTNQGNMKIWTEKR